MDLPTAPAESLAGPDLPPGAIEVARVLGAWGVQGGIKVKPYAADPQALFSTKRWHLLPGESARLPGAKAAALPTLLRVISARGQGDAVVATVQDIGDRDAAEALKGARVFVPRTSFPTPGADEFYWVDLIGLAVVNRQGLALGSVAGLIETGPHCVLRVHAAAEPVNVPSDDAATGPLPEPAASLTERLIPFVDAYVDKVDLEGRVVHVDWEDDY